MEVLTRHIAERQHVMSNDWEEQKRRAQSPFYGEFMTDANEEPRLVNRDGQTPQVLLTDADRAKWENAKQLAIEGWQNVTWEQAQEHMTKAYEGDIAHMELGSAAYDFVEKFNQSVLEANTRYNAALHEFFAERLIQNPPPPPPHFLTGNEALGMAIDALHQIPHHELPGTGDYADIPHLLPALEHVYQREQEIWRKENSDYDIFQMTVAEIETTIKQYLERVKDAWEPSAPEPEWNNDGAKWENAKQLAIEGWQNVTWEQAQEYLTSAYNGNNKHAYHLLGYTADLFVKDVNRSVFQTDTRYNAALHEFFAERLVQMSEPPHSLTGHEALGMAIDTLRQVPNHELPEAGDYADIHHLLPALEDVYQRKQREQERWVEEEPRYDIPRMTTAEIKAVIKQDLINIEANTQQFREELDAGLPLFASGLERDRDLENVMPDNWEEQKRAGQSLSLTVPDGNPRKNPPEGIESFSYWEETGRRFQEAFSVLTNRARAVPHEELQQLLSYKKTTGIEHEKQWQRRESAQQKDKEIEPDIEPDP